MVQKVTRHSAVGRHDELPMRVFKNFTFYFCHSIKKKMQDIPFRDKILQNKTCAHK